MTFKKTADLMWQIDLHGGGLTEQVTPLTEQVALLATSKQMC